MKTIQLFSILFILKLTAIITYSRHENRITSTSDHEHLPRIRLRTFAIYSLKILSDMAKKYEREKILQEEMKLKEMNMKNAKMTN